jgi:hypothetical protein
MNAAQLFKAAGSREQMRRFVLLVLCLPTMIVAVDHFTWMDPQFHLDHSNAWFHVWMVLKTGMLSWVIGRLLGGTLYGWLLLAWSVALIDLHTLTQRGGNAVFVSTMISSQAGFLVMWAILSEVAAAWRITAAIIASTIIILHASSFDNTWPLEGMSIAQSIAVVVLSGACLLIRRLGCRLRRMTSETLDDETIEDGAFRFSIIHMLVWMTVLPPLLMVLVGLNWRIYQQLTWVDAWPATLIGSLIAIVCLATIWLALGARWLIVRITAAVAALLAASYAMDLQTPPFQGPWPYEIMLHLTMGIDEQWQTWFALLSALLAAMLLFLRADGYRLVRTKPRRGEVL